MIGFEDGRISKWMSGWIEEWMIVKVVEGYSQVLSFIPINLSPIPITLTLSKLPINRYPTFFSPIEHFL